MGILLVLSAKKMVDACYFEEQLNQCFFIETEMYERLVFVYAQNFYRYRKTGDTSAIDEMRKCIETMKLAGSEHIATIYERNLKKLMNENN